MSTELPGWAGYTVTVGPGYAKYLEESGTALGGLRIMDLGDGSAALDAGAVDALKRQPADADGCIEDTPDGLLLWIQGGSFPVLPRAEDGPFTFVDDIGGGITVMDASGLPLDTNLSREEAGRLYPRHIDKTEGAQ